MAKRSGRRSSDRRTGADLRKGGGADFAGSDRRTGERRSARGRRSREDRREGEDRRAGSRKGLKKVAIWAFLAGLLPVATILLLKTYVGPIQRTGGARTASLGTREVEVEEAERARGYFKPKKQARVGDVRKSLLQIATDLYYAVKLKSKGKEVNIEEYALVDTTVSIDTIEFSVKSLKWDELDSTGKVLILNKTFNYVNEKYPDMTTIVRLTFDDGRRSLELEFE